MKIPDKKNLNSVPAGEEIVISGISGRFPNSDNVKHFEENLMNKVDLVSDDDRRWSLDHPEIPQNSGKVNNIEKFDADFFNIPFKQAHTMDPMCRMLMEHAYEAIVDAGVNPRDLRGTRMGIFVGACFSESEKTWFYEELQVKGLGITGCSRAMLTNRLSYWLGVTGPSYAVDTACSSSLYSIENAYRSLQEGQCETALVGGVNLCLHPYTSLQFYRLGVLSYDGRCKSFDEAANGYGRSETISAIFLQRAKDAKRIYATLIHAKTNCDGFKEQGITFPSSLMQSTLLKDFYEEIGIPPTSLDYLEAHATGTRVGDPEETIALDKVFCTGRKDPLWVGSIKSNLGHSEPASGLCSVVKVIIGMESGFIPPNLHFKNTRKGIKAIEEGRLKVVTEPTPWKGGLVGINSFGFGGANAHILLRSNQKEKVNGGQPQDNLPRLVGISGRTEKAVATFLNDIESRLTDVEYLKLLHDIHSKNMRGHPYRGYTIVPSRGLVKTQRREIKFCEESQKPVWYIFTGVVPHFNKIGKALMNLPVFAEAIKKCEAVLKDEGIDLMEIITNEDEKYIYNTINSTVSTVAIQIGLVDVLSSIGIHPDNMIGYSVGEFGCAYADKCLTAEQAILSAYSQAIILYNHQFPTGTTAAIDVGYKKLKNICPDDIEITCHNAFDSTIIYGPTDSVKSFITKLQAKHIVAREIPNGGVPHHSSILRSVEPEISHCFKKIIASPKPRSSKWLSTSVSQDKWDLTIAKYSSAEYHTNNILSSVLFEEMLNVIPKNAITIEIAPQAFLQKILEKSLAPTVLNIALNNQNAEGIFESFLSSVGKMYNAGLQPQLHKLYPHVAYPVSRTTPMMSHLIEWDHSNDWYVTSYRLQLEKLKTGERDVKVTLADEDFEYVIGHVVDGRNLFPATGYLVLVWETIGMIKGVMHTEFSVIFEDVKFLRATTVPKEGSIELKLMIQKGSGRFEISEAEAVVVTGYVRSTDNAGEERRNQNLIKLNTEKEIMTTRDIYKELRLRGYHYSGYFRGLKSATTDGTKGTILWNNNWVTFMDNMLQMQILSGDTRGLFVPTGITKLIIDTKSHLSQVHSMSNDSIEFSVYVSKTLNLIQSGGIEIRGLKASAISRRKPAGDPVLEEYKFVEHMDLAEIPLEHIIRMFTHISLENYYGIKVRTIELLQESENINKEELISPIVIKALEDMPLIQADVNVISNNVSSIEDSLPSKISIVESKKAVADKNFLMAMGNDLFTSTNEKDLNVLLQSLRDGGFILSREKYNQLKDIEELAYRKRMNIVMAKKSGNHLYVLFRKFVDVPMQTVVIHVNNEAFDWVESMKKIMSEELEKGTAETVRVIFVSERNFESGLIGFINCLRKEAGGEIVRGIVIQDQKAPNFSLTNPFFANELKKDLAMIVLGINGKWGSYRHLPLSPSIPKPVRQIYVNQIIRGDLNSLHWLEGPIQIGYDNANLVNIMYSSINFKDVMLATGKLAVEVVAKTRQAQECVLGFEYCGVTCDGKRVMGMMENRAMSNLGMVDPYLAWDIPNDWTFEDAATVPCVYGTSYYALHMIGKMKKGDKVLIHSGSGGVGQAAINLALFEGCEVFTTVGTPDKRKFIQEKFPSIPNDHIGNSRDTSFEQLIMNKTEGKGVDLVLNSLAEEKLQASLRCLAENGRFLEIGKFDLAANNRLTIEYFTKQISYHGVMLDEVISAPYHKKKVLKDIMDLGLKNGAIKPLSRTIFPKEQIEAAIRFMATGKHMGKVILKIHNESESFESPMLGLPRYHCLEDRSYLILGGLGGFGLELADWMVLRGAKHIVLTSRYGIKNGYQKMRVDLWKSYGTNVTIITGKDSSKREDCRYIVEKAAEIAPVDGVFNLAVVLKDAIWDNQTAEKFEESFRPKAWTTRHLDEITRTLCPKLRTFVVFSSVSCGRGNAGQTNYGMSNSVMERICERRVAEGLPGLAVQWGAVGEVGLVADMQEDNKELVIGGTLQQRISSCLQELDSLLRQDSPIVSSMVVAEKRAGSGDSTDPVETVLNILGIKDIKTISPQTPLAELGMDSMMAVEIKQTLEREFEVFLTSHDIRSLNFAKLQEMSSKNPETEKKRSSDASSNEALMGMKLLVRVIGSDDISSEICIPLNSIQSKSVVFFIPGIEGVGSVFTNLAQKLQLSSFCLQFGIAESEQDSIDGLATTLLPYVLDHEKNYEKFTIVGYSFGSMVALELMRKLEKKGKFGKFILIDGSPDLLKRIKNQHLASKTDEELQSNILLGMMDIMSPINSSELVVELEKYTTWHKKLQAFLARISKISDLKISTKNKAALCTAIYKRLQAVENYESVYVPLIETSIDLFKPSQPTLRSVPEDYLLGKLTKGKVEIRHFEGNHITILDDDELADVINEVSNGK